jgi:hypothetical protein
MALSKQNIQGMENRWFLFVGTRKTCVPLSISQPTMLISHFLSGLRKERALVRSSSHQLVFYYLCRFSSSIIQDIITSHDAGKASIAYFYFDFRDINKQKLRNLLPSLLLQLSARSDPRCDILSQLYSAHDRGVQKPNDRAMIECLKEMLSLEAQDPTYIIMDAIDECPITSSVPSPQEEVLELVDELVGLRLPNLHICVTSRPELDIRTVLEPIASNAISLHDESGQRQDITDYVRSFVYSDRKTRKWREQDKELVIRTLSEKADGM